MYLDVASVAPVLPEATRAFRHAAEAASGDPTRGHAEGRAASDLLSAARQAVAGTLGGVAERCVFTAHGTEAIHLAVRGAAGARRRPPWIISGAVEHSAVLAAADDAAAAHGGVHVRVGVDHTGRIRLDDLDAALDEAFEEAATPAGLVLVNLQHANHEVGTLQPVREAATRCRARGALLHVDACQAAGRLPVRLDDLGADYLSVSGAKVGAGAGAGALLWSPRARLRPLFSGDEREWRLRSGLPDVARIAAFAEALLQLAPDDPRGRAAVEADRADGLRRWLRVALGAVPDVAVHGPEEGTLPHVVAVSALYVDGRSLADGLDRAGFAVHSGSSCAATSGEPSHVLVAMEALTHGHVRVAFGPEVGREELDRFVVAFTAVVDDLRGDRR